MNTIFELKTWFQKTGKVEFELPDRWFGRPGDCWYILENVDINAGTLTIELDSDKKFIFNGKYNVKIVNEYVEISQFDLFVFERQRIEEEFVIRETYDNGIVRFVPSPPLH